MIAALPISDSITIQQKSGGFDTDYPARLNGIISEDEYLQSITNINRIDSPLKLCITFCGTLFVLPAIGTLLLIAILPNDNTMVYFAVFGVIILLLGPYTLYMVLKEKHNRQRRKVIDEESAKYAMRSPTSCTWRLKKYFVHRMTVFEVNNVVSTD
jgi:hypothetical protein